MINLLPENEKKNLDREYTFRLVAVALSACIVLLVVTLVVMMPVYVLALYKSNAAASVEKPQDDESVKTQEAFKKQIDDAKQLIRVLRPEEQGALPSAVVEVLVKHKSGQNFVKEIDYRRTPEGVVAVIRGIAQTRNSLSRFTDALAEDPKIAKIDVPVANFAKDTNIAYTFTITLK